jgi:hypothetical protein
MQLLVKGRRNNRKVYHAIGHGYTTGVSKWF